MKKIKPDSFIYDLLLAYGLPKASVTRLQKGNLNLSKRPGEIAWKRKVLFREEHKKDLHLAATELVKEAIHDQRFVITTDYKTLLAVDTKTNDKLDISIAELHKHFDFFLPWAGMEKSQHQGENPADVKAAEKMAKLFDEIKRDNHCNTPDFVHNLNVFLSRLLFCYFAEDTNIFEKGQFLNAISSHTQADGSDLGVYLDKLFIVLNTPVKERKNLPSFLNAFPYVNGGLFKLKLQSPNFTRRSRQAVIECGDMNWSEINPDIFGSMMQAVVTPENRGGLGMHYTSVPNIMKVIKPLFLDDLYAEFEKAKGNQKKLNELLARIYKVKIFDPACGSGNFLIIAYKELRKLEMAIFKAGNMMPMSRVSLSQFYGIEIDDFAHEIAQLSLWLAEHQMNVEFYKEFGKTIPTLPLKECGTIIQGNACQLNWEAQCPAAQGPVYILGNPPYLGSSRQSEQQKQDVDTVFKNCDNYKNLDYISCWFFKAANYCHNSNTKYAFVSTNSICQGDQVSMLWQKILSMGLEIKFAYSPFLWSNHAKNKAAVYCIIVGVGKLAVGNKHLIENNIVRQVSNINPYLVASEKNIIITKRDTCLSQDLPQMVYGSKPTDGGFLVLSPSEKEQLLSEYPETSKFIRKFIGASEVTSGDCRWCLWITDETLAEAIKNPLIKARIEKVKQFRRNSTKEATQKDSAVPHKFSEIRHKPLNSIIVPIHGSERRDYIPFKFEDSATIASNAVQVIYTNDIHIFSIIISKMHILWAKAACGKIKEDIRYSSTLGYNTYPLPLLSNKRKEELTQSAIRILSQRECHPEKTLAELYDPDKMPSNLCETHLQNDFIVEQCYRPTPFRSDEERLEHLFKLYEQMMAEEQNKGTFFESELKPKRGKK